MKDTVILVGTNTITRALVPWEREDADFWIFNECASLRDEQPDYWCKKCDAVFQMHVPAIWRNEKNLNHKDHYVWLQKLHPYPIYMQDVFEDVPASVKYPLDKIIDRFLSTLKNEKGEQLDYESSTVEYALALALYKGYKNIELYGIEANSDTEYFRQKAGILFWLGIATGRKIPVLIQSRSLLLKCLRYGYTGEVMIQRQEFEMSFKEYQRQARLAEVKTFESIGKVKAILTALAKTKSNADATRLYKELQVALDDDRENVYNYGELSGKVMENRRYLHECDELIRAAGGEKALAVLNNTPLEIVAQ